MKAHCQRIETSLGTRVKRDSKGQPITSRPKNRPSHMPDDVETEEAEVTTVTLIPEPENGPSDVITVRTTDAKFAATFKAGDSYELTIKPAGK